MKANKLEKYYLYTVEDKEIATNHVRTLKQYKYFKLFSNNTDFFQGLYYNRNIIFLYRKCIFCSLVI